MTERKRMRDWGLQVGEYPPGPLNAITDVSGVKVGHLTVIKDESISSGAAKCIRTGITAVVPYPLKLERRLLTGSFFMRPSGDVSGYEVIDDFCYLKSPVVLTNSFSAGRIYNGILSIGFGLKRDLWPPIVVSLDASYLNDMDARILQEKHLIEAVETASTGRVAEGSMGAGVGLVSYGWKGGIGSSSRRVTILGEIYHLGSLVATSNLHSTSTTLEGAKAGKPSPSPAVDKAGTLAIVSATDAPLLPHQLKGIARESALSLSSLVSPEDGIVSLAFSTANVINNAEEGPLTYQFQWIEERNLSPLFLAVREAVKEAVGNSLLMASPVKGRMDREGVPIPLELFKRLFSEPRL
ncbi:hypothetical protein CEE39_06200 [bacterium (candidate division B38) B3_B38]|nr:MAG: hypothetical protein CEE39_06200 [bacterium (candidate division B38) B3_B38]